MSREKRNWTILRVFHNAITAWVILVISILLTIVAWYISKDYSQKLTRNRFEFGAHEIVASIKHRMKSYEQVLLGSVGLFNASDKVSRDEWHDYITTLNLSENFPGIQGVGFSVPVSKEEKESHIQKIRSEGFPDFTIKPEGVRDEYSSIIYLEPFDWRNKRAFGFDMWSNTLRQEAMSRARDQGRAISSGIITLVQETDDDVQKGFLTYVPVYDKKMQSNNIGARRNSFVGWVYCAFRASDLMNGILGKKERDYEFQIYDGKKLIEENLLFHSNDLIHEKDEEKKSELSLKFKIPLQGRTWTLYVSAKPNFLNKEGANLPNFIAVGGFTIDILLFFVIGSVYNVQKRAKKIAADLTSELNDQKVELEKSNDELKQFAYAATHDIKSPINSIGNFIQIVQKDDTITNERTLKSIDWIYKSQRKAVNTIENLVEAVRIKEQSVQFSDISLNKELQRLTKDHSSDLENYNCNIELRIDASEKIFFAEAYLKVIYDNLISNAIKYRSKDRKLELEVYTSKEKEGFLTLNIKDNGIGIELSKHRDRIFGLFKRAHSHVEGTGFGLYLIKEILERYNCLIDVDSEVDVGSTFKVYFRENKI